MSIKSLSAFVCATVFAFTAAADDGAVAPVSGEEAAAAAVEEEGFPVEVEAGINLDSKYLSYGLVDNDDPILTPHACVTFAEILAFEVNAIFDMTKYGKKAGYGNRAGRLNELDPSVYLMHSFNPEDFSCLPTAFDVSAGYTYEYQPNGKGFGWSEDTQYVWVEVECPDLVIVPTFLYERDIDRDNGTYLNLQLAYEIPLISGAGEDDDPVLALTPSVAQGFGDSKRVGGYLWSDWDEGTRLHHAGLMDTCVKLELAWNVCEHFALSGYVAYSDFLFDRSIREASRGYECRERWDESWNFIGGLAATVSF